MAYDADIAGELEEKVFEAGKAFDASKSAYKRANKEYWEYMKRNHGFYKFLRTVTIVHNTVFLLVITLITVNYLVQKYYAENRDFRKWIEVCTNEALVAEFHHLNGIAEYENLKDNDIAFKFNVVQEELDRRNINPFETIDDDNAPAF